MGVTNYIFFFFKKIEGPFYEMEPMPDMDEVAKDLGLDVMGPRENLLILC